MATVITMLVIVYYFMNEEKIVKSLNKEENES